MEDLYEIINVLRGQLIDPKCRWPFIDSKTVDVIIGNRYTFSIDLTNADALVGTDLGSGEYSKMTLEPEIKNTGNKNAYIFVRIDFEDVDGDPIYDYEIDDSSWYRVESSDVDPDHQILLAYEDADRMGEVEPGGTVKLIGRLIMTLDNAAFVTLPEGGLNFKVTGCGISALDEGQETPADSYGQYLNLGGE